MEIPNPKPNFHFHPSPISTTPITKAKTSSSSGWQKKIGYFTYDFITNDNNKEVYTLHNENDDDPDADFTQLLMGLCIGLLSRQILIKNLIFFILVFDMGDEVFPEILLSELPAYGNSIALFYQEYESLYLNMWMMIQYGVVSLWTNALSLTMISEIVCLTRKHIPKPVGVPKNGKVVLEMDGELVSLDLETQESKDLRPFGYEYNFVDSNVESLLLLDKTTGGAITY